MKLPDDIDDRTAAAVMLKGMTAHFLLEIGRLSDSRIPFGVISLEAPGSSDHARWLVERLGPDGVASVQRQTWLDFAFLSACALMLSLACTLISESMSGPMKAYGIMIAWAALLAGALDEPDRCPPVVQYGNESRVAWYAGLPELPGTHPTYAVDPKGYLPRIKASNRQHPDHDTTVWPPHS